MPAAISDSEGMVVLMSVLNEALRKDVVLIQQTGMQLDLQNGI